MSTSYARPPIVEAVVEFRYAGMRRESDVLQSKDRLLKNYPKAEELREFQITVGPNGLSNSVPIGAPVHKLTSADGTKIVQMNSAKVALSHLAPYTDWENFSGEFKKIVRLCSLITKNRALTRIGVRFINRIDIPGFVLGQGDPNEYIVSLIPELSFAYGQPSTYAAQQSVLLDNGRFLLTLNSSLALSPLIDHSSIILDVEISNQVNLPAASTTIWEHMEEFRLWKNLVFESLITENSRRLFR